MSDNGNGDSDGDDLKNERKRSLVNRFDDDDGDSGDDERKTNETPNSNKTPKTTETQDPERTDTATETDEPEEETDNNDGDDDEATRPSTKDKTALTMYLSPSDVNNFDLHFQEVALEYRRKHGERLEKNADFYPAVIKSAQSHQTTREILGLSEEEPENQ